MREEQKPKEDLRNETAEEEALRRSEELLRVLFRNAYEEYFAEERMPGKPPDFSFMDEPVTENGEPAEEEPSPGREPESDTGKRSKRNPFRLLRPLRAVAVLLAAFILAGGMYCALDSQAAYAARFHLEKIMYQISGKYYSSDPDAGDRDDVIAIRITSMDDISQAVRFMPELYVPSYLPEGWELEHLELRKTIKGEKTAEYVFINKKEEKWKINEELLIDDKVINNYMDSEIVKLKHRTVTLLSDEYTELSCVQFIEEDISVVLSDQLEISEMLNVADGLLQRGTEN